MQILLLLVTTVAYIWAFLRFLPFPRIQLIEQSYNVIILQNSTFAAAVAALPKVTQISRCHFLPPKIPSWRKSDPIVKMERQLQCNEIIFHFRHVIQAKLECTKVYTFENKYNGLEPEMGGGGGGVCTHTQHTHIQTLFLPGEFCTSFCFWSWEKKWKSCFIVTRTFRFVIRHCEIQIVSKLSTFYLFRFLVLLFFCSLVL